MLWARSGRSGWLLEKGKKEKHDEQLGGALFVGEVALLSILCILLYTVCGVYYLCMVRVCWQAGRPTAQAGGRTEN